MFIFFFTTSQIFSQDNGVVALSLPVRNSLKFNKQVINPTFSFVREQNSYISFSNKRQTQFEGAPQSYLFGYSGRIGENNGAGITLFQRDFGVFTNFGGILNFAHNIVLDTDSNLTFGLNIGAYKSSLNNGKVVTNTPDPSLDNIPSHFLLTIAPGINYGTAFLDFGVSVNNLVSYNVSESDMINENPEKAIQLHAMWTGYMDGGGFFYDSRFSALVRSEFKEDKTVLSGIMMLSIPKGFWGQVGYNTFYGASAGIGFNLSKQIALEYNYEQSVSSLYDLGSAHEITLAYRFNRKQHFNYSDFDEEVSLFQTKTKKRKTSVAKSKPKKEVTPKVQPVLEPIAEIKQEEAKVAQVETEAKPEIKEVAIDTTKVVTVVPEKPVVVEESRPQPVEEVKEEVVVLEENKPAEVVPVVDEDVQKQQELTDLTNNFTARRDQLIGNLEDKVQIKQQDLDEMKEENDLSEKGIYVEPKPFKSLTAENAEIEALKLELDEFIEEQNIKLIELETVYINIKKKGEENTTMGIKYLEAIEKLKAERLKTIRQKESLEQNLEEINVATEIERKRRIKRALFDDAEAKYMQDRAVMKNIMESTPISNKPLTQEDFDLGEIQGSGIQILKDVKNTESGYYLVTAVHSDINKRDEILRKIVSTGETNIDFFYDVNTSKYYIFYKMFNDLNEAQQALKEKGSKPYNSKMTIVKIE